MKKSKLVIIGLLALSVASCHHRHVRQRRTWDDYSTDGNYYIDNGNGVYTHGYGFSPFWYYYGYHMGGGGLYYSPGVVYRSYSNHYYSSVGGSRGAVARASVGRGGFGFSGSHAGA